MAAQLSNPISTGATRDELLALPAAVGLDVANRALGLGRSKGYDLARRNAYPCRVLRLGKSYRVITADLLRLLGIEYGNGLDRAA